MVNIYVMEEAKNFQKMRYFLTLYFSTVFLKIQGLFVQVFRRFAPFGHTRFRLHLKRKQRIPLKIRLFGAIA